MIDYSRVTMMFCLPRSMSQWFVGFMRHSRNTDSWHDPLKQMTHPGQLVDKVASWLLDEGNRGRRLFIADTAASMFYSTFDTEMANMQRFFILRDETQVAESLRRQTGYEVQDLIHRQADYLRVVTNGIVSRGVSRWPVIRYDDITYGKLAKLWEYTTDHQPLTFRELRDLYAKVIDVPVRLQPHFPEQLRSLLAYREFA